MRLFYKYIEDADIAIEVTDEAQIRMSMSDVEALVDSGKAILYDTHDELNETIQYKMNRSNEYPKVVEQLDQIYHEGIDKWKETIKAVKDKHPKP